MWEKGVRDRNEDSLAFWYLRKGKRQQVLAVICDGIGGLPQGEQASSYVVRQLTNWFLSEGYILSARKQQKMIMQLWFQMHEEIMDYGKENGIRLGTTATIVLLNDRKIVWFHTGDCRLYLVRDSKVKILTKEHQEEKGRLIRAVGVGEWHLPVMGSRKIRKEDKFLLCTDGFYRNIDCEELRMWGKRKVENDIQADRMLRQIFQKKVANGERDNISALYFGRMKRES